jgi:hypothetical protein
MASVEQDEIVHGIIRTEVARPVAALVTVLFLLGIYGVPLTQLALEKKRGEEPVLLELFRERPTRERLRQFEEDLEQNSYAKDYVQPRMQALLSRFGRVGNKKAVIGKERFLYYVPGITYVSGPGFLDPEQQSLKIRAAEDAGDRAAHPDPRPAILAFRRALKARGIALIVFPVPDKAMLQPLELHGRGVPPLEVAGNVDTPRFFRELRGAGVELFDPAPAHINAGEAPRYLVQDTHWTPAYMAEVAAKLAQLVKRTVDLPAPEKDPHYRRVPSQVERVGDVTDMLKLPEGQTQFLPQSVTVQKIEDDQGNVWDTDAKSQVLLLGDSFTNVFSADFMGWGEAAGLGPQLAFELGRGVDVIAQNDSGAFATREALFHELESDPERLAGKKVVIWEFASRELSVGDWRPVAWDQLPRGAPP